MARPTNAERDEKLLAEVKTFFTDSEGSDADNRARWTEDMSFCYVPGAQWDAATLGRRAGRPNYTYNRTVLRVNQLVGDQRQARASGLVRAASKEASKPVAEIYSGLIRDIEARSNAQAIYDQAFKYAAAGGWGAWRIMPEYMGDNTFDQCLYIRPIHNVQTVFWDQSAMDPWKGDSSRCVVAERMLKEVFEELYPDASLDSVYVPRDSRGWFTDKEVRIAEYWKRVAKDAKIARLSDGRIIEYTSDVKAVQNELEQMAAGGIPVPTIEATRDTKIWTVKWWKVNGSQVLEGPIDYLWKRIPIVRLPGRYVNIEGKQYVQSLIRHTLDAQRTYNYNRSTMVEAVALTPKAPYLVTPAMIKGFEEQWNRSNASNFPYLQYNVDKGSPTLVPQRQAPPDMPSALIQLAALDAEDIRQTSGYVPPAPEAGMRDDESGVAMQTRQASSSSDSYEFIDHYTGAIKLTWEMCVDMIPTVYDTERVVRILGPDEVEKHVPINNGELDLKSGAYDVTVTVGPAYATARMEAADRLMDAAEKMPIIAEVAPDIILKNFDVQDGQELVKRVRKKLIAAGTVEPNEEEAAEMGPPPPPDPTQVALVENLNAKSAKDFATAQKTQAEMQMMPLEMEERVAEIVNKRMDSLLKGMQLANTESSAAVRREQQRATDGVPST